MGLLRLYLALCVVDTHTKGSILPWTVHTGMEAVQIFFIISGFYMQYIYCNYKSRIEFYISRFLRIYAPYYVVLFTTILVIIAVSQHKGEYGWVAIYQGAIENNGFLGVVFAAITNLTIIGQDALFYISDSKDAGLSIMTDFHKDADPLYNLLIISPSWTLSLELMFYLLVPLFTRLRTRSLLAIIILSVAMRLIAYQVFGLSNDPWCYRFFPFEIALFLLGMVSCRWHQSQPRLFSAFTKLKIFNSEPSYPLKALLYLLLFYLSTIPVNLAANYFENRQYVILAEYLCWAFAIPFFFHASKRNKLDRAIGELSYPVYLVHMPLIQMVNVIVQMMHFSPSPNTFTLLISGLSIFVSIVMLYLIVNPIDRLRHAKASIYTEKLRLWVAERKAQS